MQRNNPEGDDNAIDRMRRILDGLAPVDPTKCLEWERSRDSRGYGRMWAGGYKKGRAYFTHRLALCVKEGMRYEEIDGWLVRHLCNNPACYNPAHLILGDSVLNTRDKIIAGRTGAAAADRNARSKLSDEQIEEIRRMSDRGWRNTALAKEFGVSPQHIGRIVKYTRRTERGQ